MGHGIVALSDSHARSVQELPAELRAALEQADTIIHAGDHTEMSMLHELRAMGDVIAVAGNMDSMPLRIYLPQRQLVTLSSRLVGIAHGSGAPTGIVERVRALFPENPDLIVFGHSHVPFKGVVEGTLMVNPGPARDGYAAIAIGTDIAVDLVSTGRHGR
jgi:uncharacterized protein